MQHPSRSMSLVRLIAGAGLVAALLAATTTAAAAAPGGPAAANFSYSLDSGTVAITSGGHTWHLQVTVNGGSSAGLAGIDIGITTAHLRGTEVHDWTTDELPSRDFTVNRANGHSSVKTAAALAPVATLSLTFVPASHRKATCPKGGSGTIYTGRLTGAVRLSTGLHRLTLSKVHASFARPDTLEVSKACPLAPCSFSTWDAAGAPTPGNSFTVAAGFLAGQPGHLAHFAQVFRSTMLTAPRGAIRGDGALIKAAAPRFGPKAKSLSVSASPSGIVTGSAVISHPKIINSRSETCSLAGKTYTEKSKNYFEGTYASPKGKQFEARTLLTGVLGVTRTGTGDFSLLTLTRK